MNPALEACLPVESEACVRECELDPEFAAVIEAWTALPASTRRLHAATAADALRQGAK